MSERPEKPAPQVLSQRAILIGGLLLVVIAVVVTWLLLKLSVGTTQLDAIRTGGTLVVGAGGAVALLLTARKQRSTELELRQKHEAHLLAEQIANDAREDAIERRITDLYIKAADQLGSDKAPVRLAGLRALERLAQGNHGQRQTIVDVICAYLRMPSLTDEQEREVRLTAQRILVTHLSPSENPDKFWPDTDLDLSGAVLDGFRLSHCRVRGGFFTKTKFTGTAWFTNVEFTGDAWFTKAEFESDAGFESADFQGRAGFTDIAFAGKAGFGNTRFAHTARFDRCTFGATAKFDNSVFVKGAGFVGVEFGKDAGFSGARFTRAPRFDGSRFRGPARFTGTTFASGARFPDVTFTGNPPPEVAQFRPDGAQSSDD
ncbi:pentapeptide repeat-containing protein [Amycolatopsis xylanica]|uniref:pentapeptide repeat-containing protein n=1 Tax=Amycolatopsis xylanica TaxID=589385 RepID=UPI00115F9033|nr:pentapeptide repeat-containing protein [Amycolatopsis xylanica]